MPSEYIQVQTAAPSRADAQRIADALVGRRLAACAQVLGPVASTYRWQGAVERAEEWLCLVKTTRARYADVERAIAEVHPYDTPEIIAVDVVSGSERYLEWIGAESVE